MNYNFNKYTNRYAYLFLAAYLFLVSLTVLHYHHIDIQLNLIKIENNSGTGTGGPFDKLVDATHECMIQQFTSTVLNYSFNAVLVSDLNVKPQIFVSKEILKISSGILYNNNPLRAPPLSV